MSLEGFYECSTRILYVLCYIFLPLSRITHEGLRLPRKAATVNASYYSVCFRWLQTATTECPWTCNLFTCHNRKNIVQSYAVNTTMHLTATTECSWTWSFFQHEKHCLEHMWYNSTNCAFSCFCTYTHCL